MYGRNNQANPTGRQILQRCYEMSSHFSLPQWITTDIEKSKDEFQCPKCSNIFKYKYNLFAHLKTDCGNIKPFKCDVCFKDFSYKQNLKKHMGTFISHNGSEKFRGRGPFECPNCGRKYKHKSTLTAHLRNECGASSSALSCPNCRRSYKYKSTLMRHLRLECGNKKFFRCQECDKSFAQKTHLISHMGFIHLRIISYKEAGFIRHACRNCGRKYKHKQHLTFHLKYECGVSKKFKCNLCGKEFAQKSDGVTFRMENFATGMRFVCPNNCGKTYSSEASVKYHYRYECGKAKEFECSKCDAMSIFKKLAVIPNNMPARLEIYPCPNNCGRKYKYKFNMTKHWKYECGRKQFQSMAAAVEYKDEKNDSLSRKLLSSDEFYYPSAFSLPVFDVVSQDSSNLNGDSKRRYPCVLCHQTFTRKDNLKRHVVKLHKNSSTC
ncbi:zinc finger protein 37-like [Planococcus citri]|uniref:zinc finger protein 37-like n=1 Tax=Planococcus citri TaxID=170843 RepID=UPI0031F9DFA8